MPMYIFENPDTGEQKEVFFHMNDEKKYFDDEKKEWKRVFMTSQINSHNIDPWDNNSFVNETQNMKGNMGDLLDASKEMSEKRSASNGGVDPIKEKYFKKYSESRRGSKHPEEIKKGYESKNIKIEY
jgi:hypothetical protein